MKTDFQTLGLRPELLQAVTELGYQDPTPIQAGAIPAILAGRDVLGQAQTGTGKTAAFALPMLNDLDLQSSGVQGLVLAPTRELANQVSEAIYRYGRHRHVRVLPVYGGQAYSRQIRRLERGVHVVVGTPGRLLDLIRQGVLDLGGVRFLVLDEADEMLTMGFIEDVEAILSETPATRQTVLFSATLPDSIRRLAERYMQEPEAITTNHKRMTVAQTEQRYYVVNESDKLAALTRLLEIEDVKRTLIFARTKVGAAALAEALLGRGFQSEALHGDLSQPAREKVLRRLRQGQVMTLVATDVAARGLDIQDISHVINYDVSFDTEAYVHRIGRTGRAGKAGIAITLVTPRDLWRIRKIEAFTKRPLTRAALPSAADVLARRDECFLNRMGEQLAQDQMLHGRELVAQLAEAGHDPVEIAAAAIQLAREGEQQRAIEEISEVRDGAQRRTRRRVSQPVRRGRTRRKNGHEPGMVRLSMNVGQAQGIRPRDVVGAIASEAKIPGRAIGAIDVHRHQTYVDVSEKHVGRVLREMGHCRLRGQPVILERAG